MSVPIPSPIRPVWIASYPRSGNTFVRIIFQNIFKLATYSLYRVQGGESHDPSADALDQAPFLPRDWRQLVSDAADARLTLIKTHGLPEDSAPAIFVVRDGRACIDSYFHYHQKFAFEQPSLTDVIAGACQFGSWSEHYYAWRPRSRPRTLFLKYESIVANPADSISAIAQFLKLTPSEGRLPSFDELKGRWPAFFRRGKNEDFLAHWKPEQIALFNALHSPAMLELGYPLTQVSESCAGTLPELARTAARLHERYLQELHKQADFVAERQAIAARLQQLSGELSIIRANRWVRVGTSLGLVTPANHGPGSEASKPV